MERTEILALEGTALAVEMARQFKGLRFVPEDQVTAEMRKFMRGYGEPFCMIQGDAVAISGQAELFRPHLDLNQVAELEAALTEAQWNRYCVELYRQVSHLGSHYAMCGVIRKLEPDVVCRLLLLATVGAGEESA